MRMTKGYRSRRRRYLRLLDEGKCVRCTNTRKDLSFVYCDICRQKQKQKLKEKRKENILRREAT